MRKVMIAALAATMLLGSAEAANIVYTGSDTQDGVSISYSVTTNGNTGVLSLSDIVGSSITLTGTSASRYGAFAPVTALNTVYFSNTNPGGISPVSATLTALSFDFGNGGGLNFDGQTIVDAFGNTQGVVYALAASGINDGDAVVYEHNGLATRELDNNDRGNNRLEAGTYTIVQPTVQVFARAAVASNVPEPASWAMMVGGFGLLGAAMRRRKVAVTFA